MGGGTGSVSEAGSGGGTGSALGSGGGSEYALGNGNNGNNGNPVVEAPVDPPDTHAASAGGLDPALAKRVADFRSSVPECDDAVRAMAAMAACPLMAAAAGQLSDNLDQMMTGFAKYRSLPQSARATAAQMCKSMADNTRQALSSQQCRVQGPGRESPDRK